MDLYVMLCTSPCACELPRSQSRHSLLCDFAHCAYHPFALYRKAALQCHITAHQQLPQLASSSDEDGEQQLGCMAL